MEVAVECTKQLNVKIFISKNIVAASTHLGTTNNWRKLNNRSEIEIGEEYYKE